MDPEKLQQLWQSQSTTAISPGASELLLKEVRRNGQNFESMIFWRDVREIGIALVMIPLWFFLGFKAKLPWSWYVMAPAIAWMAGFMFVDHIR